MELLNFYRHIGLMLIIFQQLIVSSRTHRIRPGQRHQNVCYQMCPGYLTCLVRGIEQICDNTVNHGNYDSSGNLILLSRTSNHMLAYPSELILNRRMDRQYLDNNRASINLTPRPLPNRPNTASDNDQQTQTINTSEEHLYNSRIGQAITHTLRNKIGRNRERLDQNLRNFTSVGWRNSKSGKTDIVQRKTDVDQTAGNKVQTTPSVVNIKISQDSSSCTVCDGNSDCTDGNYCYYSATCARRICQPL